jgi:hypothetical protein
MTLSSSEKTPNETRASLQARGGRPRVFEKAENPRRALARLLPYLKPIKGWILLVLVFVILYTCWDWPVLI